mmetsp:Transcript_335/g.1020  ORF Transcript_335/g.1020 Transcript_335/m.1020 type:complete len:302 (-) Transcript_335:36-941(-)
MARSLATACCPYRRHSGRRVDSGVVSGRGRLAGLSSLVRKAEVGAEALALERPGLFGLGDDLDGVGVDLVPVLGGDEIRLEEGGDEADAEGAVLEVVAGVVEVDAGGGVELEHREGGGDGFDPGHGAGDAGEDLLDRRAELVGFVELGRGLAAGDADDVAGDAPVDDVGNQDGRDDELCAGVEGRLRLEGVHHRPASDHDVAVVLLAKVGKRVEAAGRGHRELRDLEAAVDRGRHRFRRRFLRRRPQHRARSMLREPLEDRVVRRLRLDVGHCSSRDLGALARSDARAKRLHDRNRADKRC